MEKLPYGDCGGMWPWPEQIIVEPRKIDGSLDVGRIGTDDLVKVSGHIRTSTQLVNFFFRHNPTISDVGGQEIMNWLCDNGLSARARTWN